MRITLFLSHSSDHSPSERIDLSMLHLDLAQKAPALTEMLIAPRD